MQIHTSGSEPGRSKVGTEVVMVYQFETEKEVFLNLASGLGELDRELASGTQIFRCET